MAWVGSQSKSRPLMLSLYLIFVTLCTPVSSQQTRPRLVSWPSRPLFAKSNGSASFDWAFQLLPSETWNKTIYELVFGVWRSPGYLRQKLIVIDTQGKIQIRQNYERKISCKYNMSLLQVAFTIHNLTKKDEKDYGLQVEFDFTRSPLTDAVKLRIEEPPKITNSLQRNVTVRSGEDLELTCQASGVPSPVVAWTRHGRVISKNHTLVLKRVTKSDSGHYLCNANSQAGEDSREVIVTVKENNDELEQKTVPSTKSPTKALISSRELIVLAACLGLLVLTTLIIVFIYRYHRRARYKKNVPYKLQVDSKTYDTVAT